MTLEHIKHQVRALGLTYAQLLGRAKDARLRATMTTGNDWLKRSRDKRADAFLAVAHEMRWAGVKRFDVIRKQCRALGINFDAVAYGHGSDYIYLRGPGWHVAYNVVSGRFGGRHPNGEPFTHESRCFDGEEWYEQVLAFFYIPKAGAAC